MTQSAGDTDEAASASLPVQDPWFAVTQLPPDLFRITEPGCHRWVRANCFLILGRDRDILVDSGMGVAALRPILDRLSTRPRLVFTTHAHVDHVGSHPEFADCEILVHPAEADDLARPGRQRLRFPKRSAEEIAELRKSGFEPSDFMIEAVPLRGQIPLDDVEHLRSRHGGVVTAEDLCDQELCEPLHRRPIRHHVRPREVVDDDAVIDGVSRKERAARTL
jgi:Metallo-beta-lactamase superfamily